MFVFINCLGLNLLLCLFQNVWICCELRTKPLSTAFGIIWWPAVHENMVRQQRYRGFKGQFIWSVQQRKGAAVEDPPDKKKGGQLCEAAASKCVELTA